MKLSLFWQLLFVASVIGNVVLASDLASLINRRQQKLIESSMDLKADPCEDYYQYACGKWGQHIDGAGSKFYETLTMLDYQVNRELSHHMARLRLRNGPRFVRKAYEYYKSCVDVDRYKPLEYLRWMKLHENLKWPTLWANPKPNIEFDWVRTLAVMRRYGMNGILIEEVVYQKKDDPSRLSLDLDKPVESGGFVALTKENLRVLIESLDVPMNSRTFGKLWQEIRDFEELLLKLDDISDEEGSRLITIKELPLPWLNTYLEIILEQTTLDPNMELYIQNIPYLEALDALLQEYDNRFICKYLEIRFLWHVHIKGPENFMEEDCMSSTRSLLPLAMHWIYEQQKPELLQEQSKIHELFQNIIKQFKKQLQQNTHGFNETILTYLLNKLDHIQLKIGNLPRINTVAVLEQHYANLTLNVSDFYGNHLKLLAFNFRAVHLANNNTLSTNASHYFHLENYETGSSSSPYFIQRSNIVIIPVTALQRPIYHPSLEDIYKYSSLGFLLAHEILHGFDYTGLEVDINGKLNTAQYNNILANTNFDDNYQCLRQLNPYVIDEKIADVSGLPYAYDTFFSLYPEALNKTRQIYGIQMPLKKLFFLNFAQFFCGITTSDSDDYLLSTSEHGMGSDRVNDALTHFPEFAKEYNCGAASRLQTARSCNLWRR
ncbi:neprilysin-2-like [Musca vetustissima]|uniref:neprilysin-2-like n=1 Tax=Musca vetustissima TaxID=27455 RepID=UPI002AB69E0E|nr:neprilysin-2-like [Musca vetustissima]